ncbi:AMP-binding protein [Methylocystis sp.]|uniref:AMP-binding protein n=1 Tax=Methylocystis sp. TaxID=1911079 RepID=UPI0025F29B38|nr:AMP-binding protein [Methylocystis sp.]
MSQPCFHHSFEAQVLADAGRSAVAIEFCDEIVTYRDLDARANRLANYLIELRAGPEVAVGVAVPRSPDLLVCLLAVAKAGAAYVPLDAGLPEERRLAMIENSGLALLLVTGNVSEVMPRPGFVIVDLYAAGEEIGRQSDKRPKVPVCDRNLAYLLYTSGSTGEPKGTAMEHSALANLIAWHGAAHKAACGLRTLQFCSIGFDFSFHEIFSTLCYGGTLIVPTEAQREDPFLLARLIRDRRVEKLFLPVSALLQWASVVDERSFPDSLRHVITTGEPLHITPPLREIFRRTGAQLHNHFGATEFQDAATLSLSGDPGQWPLQVPIGHPLGYRSPKSTSTVPTSD